MSPNLEIKIGPYRDILRPREGLHLIVELTIDAEPSVPGDALEEPLTAAIPLDVLRDALATLHHAPGPTTVEEWNARAVARIKAARASQEIKGLKCPKCGGELVDTEPRCILASNPPKKRLDCMACQNIEYVYV